MRTIWIMFLFCLPAQAAYHWDIQTQVPEAQNHFNEGMLYFYGFSNEAAVDSFKKAYLADPECALCHWGAALASWPFIEKPGNAEDQLAQKEVKTARILIDKHPNQIASLLIQAAETNFSTPKATLDERTHLYANAMRKAFSQARGNADVAALFVNALMNLSGGTCHSGVKRPLWNTPEIREVLDAALKADPLHPGAHHFAIHSAEVSDHPERALDSAALLPSLVPNVAHYVHMPAHLFIRLGRYLEAIEANQKAIAVDETFLKTLKDPGQYYEGFYLHNYYFRWASAALAGEKSLALDFSKQLVNRLRLKRKQKFPYLNSLYILTSLQTQIRFGMWDEILAEKDLPWNQPLVSVVHSMGRGLAHLKRQNLKSAEAELQNITKKKKLLPKHTNLAIESDIGEIAFHLLSAEYENHKNNWKKAQDHYFKAVELEDEIAYSEPPPWNLPVRDFYAQALLNNGHKEEALAICQTNLKHFPNHSTTLEIVKKIKAQ